MKELDAYLEAIQDVYAYFDYQEHWRVYPIDDCREMYWMMVRSDKVVWSDEPFTEETITEGNRIYSGEIYHTPIYRKEKYTAMIVDTNTDGNIFLMIFDNTKEELRQDMKELYNENW